MKIYEIIHRMWNKRGRLIIDEHYTIGFNTESELAYYMRGKWAMCENNESYIAYELQA